MPEANQGQSVHIMTLYLAPNAPFPIRQAYGENGIALDR